MNNGWIKLHRKLLDNPIIMKDSDHLAVWIYLLLNATHAEYAVLFKGEKILLKPGQLITGRKKIAAETHVNESKVFRILNCFKTEQQIEQQVSNKNSLITILSWDDYQNCEQQNEQQVNIQRTTSEQQVNTNKNVKNNKNDKNDKNEKNKYVEDALLNEAIIAFVDFRKKVKKPMTDKAIDLMIGKLNKLESDTYKQIEILNQSILNGWSGIYALKKETEAKPVKRKEMVPSWMSKEKNQYDFDELEREIVSNAPDPEVQRRAQELQERLQAEYGKE